jgi:IclR family acetate operon transcriptional repressor
VKGLIAVTTTADVRGTNQPQGTDAAVARSDESAASRSKPPYAITSVDNALQLVRILEREGSVRVSDAAAELGVAKSTAHRLLGMLCFRDFARKDDDHLYWRGPALGQTPTGAARRQNLSAIASPVLERLQGELNETVHLQVLRRTEVEFLRSLECSQPLRVTSRAGAVIDAIRTSGGQALLAALPDIELAQRFPEGVPGAGLDSPGLVRALDEVRRRGYGINEGLTERGVVAIGASVRDALMQPVAALCVSAPAFRLQRTRFRQAAEIIHRHVALLEDELIRAAQVDA